MSFDERHLIIRMPNSPLSRLKSRTAFLTRTYVNLKDTSALFGRPSGEETCRMATKAVNRMRTRVTPVKLHAIPILDNTIQPIVNGDSRLCPIQHQGIKDEGLSL
ncbi:hypothetical protein HHI36_010265 [Cryptolaemus montrouzieri]|uniref:Uncharacterized protein n=1 Tax=Cryptolaemus montrouzieri TaxID=559131 RepID=A0ABD2MI90_9CUCU